MKKTSKKTTHKSVDRATPFIKWVGGKTHLLFSLRQRMPEYTGTYVEPFVGGGALFYDTCPTQAVLNDANSKLVNLYINVRDHKDELVNSLNSYESEYNTLSNISAKKDFYYQNRTKFNARGFETDLTVDDAARFIFLNKTNFNDLYRENAKGEYNAAFGWKKSITLYEANLANCSAALKNVNILNGDFEDVCDGLGLTTGDFVYLDPPYHSTFNGYQKGGFSEGDQVRLYNLFQRLTESGVLCMLSNGNTDFIKNLYAGYNIDVVPVKCNINRNGNGRQGEKVIITDYKSSQIIQL